MSISVLGGESQNYFVQLFALSRSSVAQLVRAPSHARRGAAARHLGRQLLLLTAIGGALLVVLMISFDATEITLMPSRGTPSLWPVRILTDFGKDSYVLWTLLAALAVIALLAPALHGASRARFLRLGTRVQYVLLAVACSDLLSEILKYAIGRGRPFVGGKANAFNFMPFAGTEAYFSLPSSHAVTAFALAFAIGAVWPRARIVMYAYAVVIAGTRLVLLAHHPSDVVGGAIVGIAGAMAVRYWFAARRLGFAIRSDGKIVPI
ncbi:phosphatase PAP2 family protein [Bradyrhizobium sp. ARR65]|uniref:phosphatase PAP2 family protein n=1 Tax=Bradyrhizobium sp. ARR65 TaxID=1040989 RepID=UPI00046540A8|nr:phosphatase PAP2 family protein [Bradyrhizobium sp. ARR65]